MLSLFYFITRLTSLIYVKYMHELIFTIWLLEEKILKSENIISFARLIMSYFPTILSDLKAATQNSVSEYSRMKKVKSCWCVLPFTGIKFKYLHLLYKYLKKNSVNNTYKSYWDVFHRHICHKYWVMVIKMHHFKICLEQ